MGFGDDAEHEAEFCGRFDVDDGVPGIVDNVVSELRDGAESKILVTAVGGVGKSTLTSVLNEALPVGSVTIVYDCFAGGDY
ncbi:hypothetical protein R4P64_32075 [Rhodococcus sp. IEGM 1366]|uniref:hypothetical protein n=1 Tax=Rhodococcus sp. IEGM 1366 TaxID=3082223 RepID=UPI0029545F95|nr:hypothetical protein [Rhodococcus sp. IEGM 1366]MDV8071157.1 hypothetical protein [Rhodococcus sp. IEGM 1366]